MNQQQRNFLCNQVKKKFSDLRRKVSSKRRSLIPSKAQDWWLGRDSNVDNVPKELKKEYAALKKEHERIHARWNMVVSEFNKRAEAFEYETVKLLERVNSKEEKVILSVWFADCLEDAERVLNSIPSLEEILR